MIIKRNNHLDITQTAKVNLSPYIAKAGDKITWFFETQAGSVR